MWDKDECYFFSCLSLKFYQILSHVFWGFGLDAYMLGIVKTSWRTDSSIAECLSLSPIAFLAMRLALSEINAPTSVFFWLMWEWSISLCSFTFNLSMCLYVNWVAYRLPIIWSFLPLILFKNPLRQYLLYNWYI